MAAQFKITPEKSFARGLIIFCILWTAAHIYNHHNLKTLLVCVIALGAIAVAVRKPAWLYPVNYFWSALGYVLGLVMVPIVSAILYYLVVTPMALVLRQFGYDPLQAQKEKDATTYWQPYKHSSSMKSPF